MAHARCFFSLTSPLNTAARRKLHGRPVGSLASAWACTGACLQRRAPVPRLGRRGVVLQTGTALLLTAMAPFGLPHRAAAASGEASSVEKILREPNWPDTFPLDAEAFRRYDESSDTNFYAQPRFVTHIDDAAIASLKKFYAEVFPPSGSPDVAVLDLCSSWISHYPEGYKAGRVAGMGMNEKELAANGALTEHSLRDLNTDPRLPYEDAAFDVITNAVSVDYLTKPMEVFREMHRVLKPGGLAVMSFSNRCFPTKAIAIWTQTGDPDHIWIVGSYFHFSVPGGWESPQARDITAPPALGGYFGRTDPMYVVYARKQA